MLRASSCPSCVWMQASPLNFTNVAACTEELALSLFTPLTTHLSLWFIVLIHYPVLQVTWDSIIDSVPCHPGEME